MGHLQVQPEALQALKDFTLPEEIGFGSTLAPVMITCEYKDGKWGELVMKPYGPLQLDPTAKVLHYAQEIFEGLKAYKVQDKGPFLFRPDQNAERFNVSAQRMAMPDVPVEYFLDAVRGMTSYCSHFIPRRKGESLYIRPFVFATETNLGIKPSDEFLFITIASPSGAYFSDGTVPVLIEREAVRACPGGVGQAKTGGNYAASLLSAKKGRAMGFKQTLWLDAVHKKDVEEMSGMNFCCVIDNILITPKLTDTILDGITRKSLLALAKHLDIETREETIEIEDLLSKIKSGQCSEAFACGTAAIITPIHALGEADGTMYPLKEESGGPIAIKLRDAMLDIQEGRMKDPFDWVVAVEPAIL
jgi:branched-chain amino acid aminotransferase